LGVAIWAPRPRGYAAVSGTSVAAAQAAGLVAVLGRPARRLERPRRLRSAADLHRGAGRGLDAPLAPVQAQGGGRPDGAAASAVAIADEPGHAVARQPGADGVAHGKLTVENLTDTARTLGLGLQRDAAGDTTGLTAAIDPARFILAPHAVATLPVAVRLQTRRRRSAWPGAGSVITPDSGARPARTAGRRRAGPGSRPDPDCDACARGARGRRQGEPVAPRSAPPPRPLTAASGSPPSGS